MLMQQSVVVDRLLSATASSPLVLTAPDVVLWWKRLKDGNGEGDSVSRLVHHLLGQQPGLRVVDVLILGVLHPDVPPHAIAMRPVLPLEGGLNVQLHPQNSPAERHALS
jgi:hypothetical protein